MPAKDGFQLTDGDIELLHFTYQLRLATLDHLAALTGRSYTRTHKRVSKLEERRYFNRITKQPQKALYTIGPEGVPVLIEHGYAPQSVAGKRLRAYELKELGRQHTLFIADIHAKLLLLTKTGPIKLIHWQEGPALWDHVVTQEENGRDIGIPIRQDAYFILEHTGRPEGKNRLHIFLEADRSTMSHERMALKTRGYVAYHHQGLYQRRYPAMKYFLVATVTQTRERALNLQQDLSPHHSAAVAAGIPIPALRGSHSRIVAPFVVNPFPLSCPFLFETSCLLQRSLILASIRARRLGKNI